MNGPKLDMTITFGSVLSIATVLVTAGIAYGVYSQQTENIVERIDTHAMSLQQETESRRSTDTALEGRIRILENSQARADERFNSVLQILGRIEARLERIEGR